MGYGIWHYQLSVDEAASIQIQKIALLITVVLYVYIKHLWQNLVHWRYGKRGFEFFARIT